MEVMKLSTYFSEFFCNPSTDKAMTFSPTYGMYDVTANINDIELIIIKLNEVFDIEYGGC